jgi:hypothetical protein
MYIESDLKPPGLNNCKLSHPHIPRLNDAGQVLVMPMAMQLLLLQVMGNPQLVGALIGSGGTWLVSKGDRACLYAVGDI